MAAPERAIIEQLINDSLRPSWATWLKHLGFLLVTFLTTTIAGVLYPFGLIPVLPEADPQTWPEIVSFLLSLPAKYVVLIGSAVGHLLTDTAYLTYGLSFSLSLLFILICHGKDDGQTTHRFEHEPDQDLHKRHHLYDARR